MRDCEHAVLRDHRRSTDQATRVGNIAAQHATVRRPDGELSLGINFTLLESSGSEDSECAYVVPFENNGEIAEHDFTPHITSSPNDLLVSSTITSNLSDIEHDIKCTTSSPICRPHAGANAARRIEDTIEDEKDDFNLSELIELVGYPRGLTASDLWFLKYIDDGLAGEQLPLLAATTHITTGKEVKIIHAGQSEKFFKTTLQNPLLIGMKINAAKAQMLCINVATNLRVNTYINLNDHDQITGKEELKMLGFTFRRRPNADVHIKTVSRKVYGRLWTIKHLQKCLLPAGKLGSASICELYQACNRIPVRRV